MKIAVIGGAGDVGSRLVIEASSRGHDVTAIARSANKLARAPEGVTKLVMEIQGTKDLIDITASHDVLVSAIRPPDGQESSLVTLTSFVLEAARDQSCRVLIVGGAARLKLANDTEETVLTAPNFLPQDVVPIAMACQQQFELWQQQKQQDGTYLSPPAMLLPGNKTGKFRLGNNVLVCGNDGQSSIAMEDFAVAMMNEVEQPAYKGRAFTVGY